MTVWILEKCEIPQNFQNYISNDPNNPFFLIITKTKLNIDDFHFLTLFNHFWCF